MSYNILKEDAFDFLLKRGLIDNLDDEIREIDNVEKITPIFSEQHNERIYKELTKSRNKDIRRNIFLFSKRVVAVIILISCIIFGALMTKAEVRAAVNDTIIEWHDQFVRFINPQLPESESKIEWDITKLPMGYNLTETIEGNTTVKIYKNNKNDYIYFQYMKSADDLGIDNENREYILFKKGNIEYHIFKSNIENKYSSIIWDTNGYRFKVEGYLTREELIEIAETIKNNLYFR